VTKRKPAGVSFETWVDTQIRKAQEEGAFENLAGAGRPLPRRHGEQSSYEWALEWARRENVDPLGMLPPGLALRRERETMPERLAGLPTETAVRAVVEDFNARVDAYWRRPADGPQVPVGQADVDEAVARWRATRPPPPPTPAPPPPRRPWWRRRWWRRRWWSRTWRRRPR
jgi:Domain of unknown function (DUF1992)